MESIIKNFEKIPTRILLYLFIISLVVSLAALRHNNQRMVALRDQVYAADKNNGDVNAALNNLRRYVTSHMNTDLSSGNSNIKPPIQLKYTYQRLYNAQADQMQLANQKLYDDARAYCQSIGQTQFDGDCAQNYVVNHGAKSADINIPAGLYEFDFLSPSWSPDLAGWSLVASVLLGLALLTRAALARR